MRGTDVAGGREGMVTAMKTLYRDQHTPACFGVVLIGRNDWLGGTLLREEDMPGIDKRLVIAARVTDRLLNLALIEGDDDEQQ